MHANWVLWDTIIPAIVRHNLFELSKTFRRLVAYVLWMFRRANWPRTKKRSSVIGHREIPNSTVIFASISASEFDASTFGWESYRTRGDNKAVGIGGSFASERARRLGLVSSGSARKYAAHSPLRVRWLSRCLTLESPSWLGFDSDHLMRGNDWIDRLGPVSFDLFHLN